MKKLTMIAGLAAMLSLSGAAFATQGNVVLAGTDAISLHGDAIFSRQLIAAELGTNIAEVSDFGTSGALVAAGAAVTSFSDLAAANAAVAGGGFSSVFIASPGRCCTDPMNDPSLGLTAANLSALQALVNGGTNVYVEDFLGSAPSPAAWSSLLGFDPTPMVFASSGCGGDPGVATVHGFAEGFTGNAPEGSGLYREGCWVHQAYHDAFVISKGYIPLTDISAVINPATGAPYGPDSTNLIESHVRLETPEPSTLMLLGTGLVGLISRKRKS